MIINRIGQKIISLRSKMNYRRLGRSSLTVSAIGFGTCQLRMVPERQAIETLKRGFELGVNFVHTAPDYEGAEDLVAQAIAESGRDILVFTQGYGDRSHFEWLFETACRKFNKKRLEIFGIACVEDREYLNENVWEKGGMIEFLLEKKMEGRLGSIFAETHGQPEYIAKLIKSGVFDAVLLAYNELGFHALSYFPEAPKRFEDIPRNKTEIFPLARQHGVAVMLMKTLGGGLICPGKAFPPHVRFSLESESLSSRELLRHLLSDPNVTCVVPGTASPEEAEENAIAGHDLMPLRPERLSVVNRSISEMITTLCSRCGLCEALCSQNIPVSWLFRDAYISSIRSETFETIDRLQYFHLHCHHSAPCVNCKNVTCNCPQGIDIPANLSKVHDQMLSLREKRLLAATPSEIKEQTARGPWYLKIISKEISTKVHKGESVMCRLWVENAGTKKWLPSFPRTGGNGPIMIAKFGKMQTKIYVRHEVEPGTRTHFSFEIETPKRSGKYPFTIFFRTPGEKIVGENEPILACLLEVS